MITVAGVDPGIAVQGVVVLESSCQGSTPVVAAATLTKTKKQDGPKLLVRDDDVRRLRKLLSGFAGALDGRIHAIDAIAIETFAARLGATNAASAKTSMAYTAIITASIAWALPVLTASPQDIKRKVAGDVKASKRDMLDAVLCWVPSMADVFLDHGRSEHLADAAAHALLGIWKLEGKR